MVTPPLPDSLILINYKDIKQVWPKFLTLGDTTGAWP